MSVVCTFTLVACSPQLSVPFANYCTPCSVRPVPAAPVFTPSRVLSGHWPPGLSFTPRRFIEIWPTPGFIPPPTPSSRVALMGHCWAGQAIRVWQGYTRQWAWIMATGPVWDALIHTTSCHLSPFPACSPSAAARLLSPLMSIFRAGWFLASKMGKCVVEQQGVYGCVCEGFFCCCFCVFLRHTNAHSQPTRPHVSQTPTGPC